MYSLTQSYLYKELRSVTVLNTIVLEIYNLWYYNKGIMVIYRSKHANNYFVTHYGKTDHLRFLIKIAFRVWIDAEFSVEFNDQIARL